MTEQTANAEQTAPVYGLFVKYGFKSDADVLVSTGKDGTVQGLGKYIAILENCKPKDRRYNEARDFVYKYLDAQDAFNADAAQRGKIAELRGKLEKIIGREK